MHRFFWTAVVLLACGLSACLASNAGSPGDVGGFAADSAEDSSGSARTDQVDDQTKPHPGSVAAPDADMDGDLDEYAAKGTIEVLCRSKATANFGLRLKGQIFTVHESGKLEPCMECAGLLLTVRPDCAPDEACVFLKSDLIQENGYFDITGNFPDPHALSLSYHSIVTHSVDNFLLLDENALEAAPDCPMHIKFPSNEGAPLFKKPIPLGPSIPY